VKIENAVENWFIKSVVKGKIKPTIYESIIYSSMSLTNILKK
jgi:hypothetical protein